MLVYRVAYSSVSTVCLIDNKIIVFLLAESVVRSLQPTVEFCCKIFL